VSLRIWLLLLCFALIVSGGEMLRQSAQMPQWTDEAKAQEVMTWDPPAKMYGPEFEAYYQRWTEALKSVRTQKWLFKDEGASMIALALSLAAAVFLFGVRSVDDVQQLQTPDHRWEIWLLLSAGWFGYMASALVALFQGFDRWEFPPWADSLLQPIVGLITIAVAGWVILSFAIWLVLRHAALTANMWVWRKDLPMHTGLSAVAAGLSLLISLELLRETYLYGHWSAVPPILLWIYATLALRAAAVSRTGYS
jgi:hypothetical protein